MSVCSGVECVSGSVLVPGIGVRSDGVSDLSAGHLGCASVDVLWDDLLGCGSLARCIKD